MSTAAAGKVDVRQRIMKQMALEKNAHEIALSLIDRGVSSSTLIEACAMISASHYRDVVEERALTAICGYPLCQNAITFSLKQTYRISTSLNRVFDITERKNFCSNQCFKASKYLETQIHTSPVWSRGTEYPPTITLLPCSNSRGGQGDAIIVCAGQKSKECISSEVESSLKEDDLNLNMNKLSLHQSKESCVPPGITNPEERDHCSQTSVHGDCEKSAVKSSNITQDKYDMNRQEASPSCRKDATDVDTCDFQMSLRVMLENRRANTSSNAPEAREKCVKFDGSASKKGVEMASASMPQKDNGDIALSGDTDFPAASTGVSQMLRGVTRIHPNRNLYSNIDPREAAVIDAGKDNILEKMRIKKERMKANLVKNSEAGPCMIHVTTDAQNAVSHSQSSTVKETLNGSIPGSDRSTAVYDIDQSLKRRVTFAPSCGSSDVLGAILNDMKSQEEECRNIKLKVSQAHVKKQHPPNIPYVPNTYKETYTKGEHRSDTDSINLPWDAVTSDLPITNDIVTGIGRKADELQQCDTSSNLLEIYGSSSTPDTEKLSVQHIASPSNDIAGGEGDMEVGKHNALGLSQGAVIEKSTAIESKLEQVISCSRLKPGTFSSLGHSPDPPITPSTPHVTPLDAILHTLREWKTPATTLFLIRDGETCGMSSSKLAERYVELGRRVDRGEFEVDEDLDSDDEDPAARQPQKGVPEWAAIQAETTASVSEFLRGSLHCRPVMGEGEVLERTPQEQLRLPLVDSRAQLALRRNIVLDKLSRVLPTLTAALGSPLNDVTTELSGLVHTFELSSTNILLKPAQWTLMAYVILWVLAVRKPRLCDALRSEENNVFLRTLITSLGSGVEELQRSVAFMATSDASVG